MGRLFSPFSERESFDGVKILVNGEQKVEKAAQKHSRPADHAIRLLTLDFSKHLHCLFGNSRLCALKDDKLSE